MFSGIFSAHHQEFSTVHSALVSFMQVFDDRFKAESGWNRVRIISTSGWLFKKKSLHRTAVVPCTGSLLCAVRNQAVYVIQITGKSSEFYCIQIGA
jgi:hypothetical protein